MAEVSIKLRGSRVAAILAGSWRRSPTSFECSASELKDIAPLLINSGAAALCWPRLKHSNLRKHPATAKFQETYRLNTLQSALHQRAIEQTVALLRSAQIEPILVKGWCAAQLYPEPGLRPAGDIDLCVPPKQFASAQITLKNFQDEPYDVDLHEGFAKFGGGDFDQIYRRSRLAPLGETNVRVSGAEDHLRLLCIHMLREGGWRPLWLCDIAAAVESLPENFDWDCCLTEDRKLADWVICAVRLAQQLLGADITSTPIDQRAKQIPRWLVPTILKEWGAPLPSMTQRHQAPMANFLRHPAGLLKALRHRWPNPIEATVNVRGSFNELPNLPFQLGDCLARTAKFAARLPRSLRRE